MDNLELLAVRANATTNSLQVLELVSANKVKTYWAKSILIVETRELSTNILKHKPLLNLFGFGE